MLNRLRRRWDIVVAVFWWVLAFQFMARGLLGLIRDEFSWFYIAFLVMGFAALIVALTRNRKRRASAHGADTEN